MPGAVRSVLTALAGLALLAAGTLPAAATEPPNTGLAVGEEAGQEPVGGQLMARTDTIAPPGAPALPPGVNASGWVVADLDSGAVLAARNPHGRYLPASTLKTLTALTLLPRLTDRSKVVVATEEDAGVDGTRVGLVPGGRYTVEMLFKCMLMMSGNDCAHALARAAGGLPHALQLMNTEADRLRARDTHAATPSGLDGPGQSTSAYDLALILREALHQPDFGRYNTTLRDLVPAQPPKYGSYEFSNDNRLLANYPGVLATKNGYTNAARHSFVAAAEHGDRRLVVTLLHAERRPVDTWKQARALLDWGFALPADTSPLGTLVPPESDRAAAAQPKGDATERDPAGDQPNGTGESTDPRTAAQDPASATGNEDSHWWPAAVGGIALFMIATTTALMLRRLRSHPRQHL